MSKFHLRKCCYSLETFTFLILCGLSTMLTWNVVMKYKSRDSSFKQSRVPITNFATIVICPYPKLHNVTYGENFNISKYDSYGQFQKDRAKMNDILNIGYNQREQVVLEFLQTGFKGECYKIQPSSMVNGKGIYQLITINEKPMSNEDIKVYVTSKLNSDGILLSYWLDGEILEFNVKRNTFTEVGLSEKETVYLQEKSNCTDSGMSFYDCFFSKILKESLFDGSQCNVKCLPMTIKKQFFPSSSLPYSYCQNISNSDYNCIANYIFEKLQNISTSELCLKPCKINEYVGKVTFTSEKPNLRTIFVYYFKPPEVKNINEEYILYDINAVISAIGGSLGLCVGFSIRGFDESI